MNSLRGFHQKGGWRIITVSNYAPGNNSPGGLNNPLPTALLHAMVHHHLNPLPTVLLHAHHVRLYCEHAFSKNLGCLELVGN